MACKTDLVAHLVEVTMSFIDICMRNLASNRQHRRAHRFRSQHCRRRVCDTGARNNRTHMWSSCGNRRAESHVTAGLLVPWMNDADTGGGAIKRVKKRIALKAWQAKDNVGAVGGQRCYNGIRSRRFYDWLFRLNGVGFGK